MKRFLWAVLLFLTACASTADVSAETEGAGVAAYEPMQIFAPLAGKVLRGEGTGPDGEPVVDFAKWEFILGGRAFQSTHKLEGHSYGGRTIFFFDEGAKKYIFHYFTTAGFHTTGEVTPTDDGFVVTEKVIGHPEFVEVRSRMFFEGDVVRVTSSHVDKDGNVSEGEGFDYREVDEAARAPDNVLFFDEADALFGKRSDIKDAHDRYENSDQ